jgi:hypothetical protein
LTYNTKSKSPFIMKKISGFLILLFSLTLLLSSCSPFEKDYEGSNIKNQPLEGICDNVEFKVVSTLAQRGEFEDKEGIWFHFYNEKQSCEVEQLHGNTQLFVELPPNFSTGIYSIYGPFFYNHKGQKTAQHSGLIDIREVTKTEIIGKVKGGEFYQGYYLEGQFNATICE